MAADAVGNAEDSRETCDRVEVRAGSLSFIL